MAAREGLEKRAAELASRLADELVESSEQVDFRMGTFLLSALTAELGQRVQQPGPLEPDLVRTLAKTVAAGLPKARG